jgi:hypothetical protein
VYPEATKAGTIEQLKGSFFYFFSVDDKRKTAGFMAAHGTIPLNTQALAIITLGLLLF